MIEINYLTKYLILHWFEQYYELNPLIMSYYCKFYNNHNKVKGLRAITAQTIRGLNRNIFFC